MRSHKLSRFVCGLVCMFGVATLALSPAYGTYFVATVVADHLVVAIDSRVTVTNPARAPWQSDQYCKIMALSDQMVFFDTGATALTNGNGEMIFDAREIARQAYEDGQRSNRIEDLSGRWAVRMVAAYIAANLPLNYSLMLPGVGSELKIRGFFAGRNADGNLIIYGQQITRSPLGIYRYSPEFIKIGKEESQAINNGYSDILAEFADHGVTQRAKNVLMEAEKEAVGKSNAETMAIRLGAYVRAVRDWSGDPRIGGDVAVIVMEGSERWKWFRRPDFCPDD
jgi:hypothetical protein